MTKQELLDRIKKNHKHHPPQTPTKAAAHEAVREITAGCALALVEVCPISRELSLALTAMEEVMMWANAAIARNEEI